MPGTKTSALAALTTVADGDLIPVVDVSDTTMASTGTTKRSVASDIADYVGKKTGFVYDARWSGATITAVTLQAAVDIVEALGGGVVELPHDTTITLAARVDLGDNVKIRGDRSTTIASTNSTGAFLFTGSRSVIEGVTIDLAGAASTAKAIDAVSGSTLVGNAVRNCRIVNAPYTVGGVCRVSSAYDGFEFSGNDVESCASGLSINPAAASKGLRIVGNRFRDVGLVVIQVYATSLLHTGVTIDDNYLADFDTPSTAIPIEVTGSQEVAITNNRITTAATRGVSTGNCEGLVIAHNTIKAQTAYAVELNGGKRITVLGNITKDCACLFDTTGNPVEDLAVIGNVHSGSGLSSAASTTWVMHVRQGKRVRIADNVITDWQYLGGVIRIGNAFTVEDVTISGNEIQTIDANTSARAINVATALRTRIRHNRIMINRNLAAADDFFDVIVVQIGATNVDNYVEDNEIVYLGTVSAATNHNGIGHRNTGAGACAGLRIARNKVVNGQIGIYSNATSTDAEIVDNETRTCATADTIPATLRQRRTMREHEASAAPTTGTWRVGDRVWNTGVAAAGVPGWICTTAGTPGTWKAMAAVAV